jgi:two-component sensor histidine kinase
MLASILSKGRPLTETQDGITVADAQQLLREKDLLFEEMQHRVGNSLQIVASILLIKTRAMQSEEARSHLLDAHQRVLSVAAVQKHLHLSGRNRSIQVGDYLTKLCETLAQSMIADGRPTALEVDADFNVVSPRDAVSLGLIVTELVMNALKHAFPDDTPGAAIRVAYSVTETGWKLAVSDNGAGKSNIAGGKHGLGTSLIQALGKQLDALVDTTSGRSGTTVSMTHGTLVTPVSAIEVKPASAGVRRSPQ